jgi:hypothetical protein
LDLIGHHNIICSEIYDEIAMCQGECLIKSAAIANVTFLLNEFDSRILFDEPVNNKGGIICAGIIGNDDLNILIRLLKY